MPKNIVICCDGTGNQFGEVNSNVVKLFSMLDKSTAGQVAFYDPGVGTMSDPNVITPWNKYFSKLLGLAFGYGLMRNITDAYSYLMEQYEEGDKVFLFGFSRGAFTARALAGMIYKVGVLEKGCQNLIPYALKTYKISYNRKNKGIASQFKATYSRNVKIDFIGVWDTVSSIGLFNSVFLPNTTANPHIKVVRHAMAIDERRAYYRQNLFSDAVPNQDRKQVWFAGAHSDVGGSYPEYESGLSQIALEWMVFEAIKFGLAVDKRKLKQILYSSGAKSPDILEKVHKSLSGGWWMLEFMPRRRKRDKRYFIPLARYRRIFNGGTTPPLVHKSVVQKMSADVYSYQPRNLNGKFDVEEYNHHHQERPAPAPVLA